MSDLNKSTNHATQILRRQSERLLTLRDEGYFEDFRHMGFDHLIVSFYEDQGKPERIKNFPFPRQYASTSLWLCYIFCALLPLGMMDILGTYGHFTFWLSSFLSALVIWVFCLMALLILVAELRLTCAKGIKTKTFPDPLSTRRAFYFNCHFHIAVI